MTISAALVSEVSVSASHTMICPGTRVNFSAAAVNEGSAPVYEWLINGTQVQQGVSPVFSTNTLLSGQPVICRLTSSLSCVAQATVSSLPISMAAASPPTVVLSDQDYLCTGTATPLDAGPDFSTYLWQDGSTGRYMNVTTAGTYRVTVSDSLGCIGSDSVVVKKCSGNVYVPNAFTPNGDGLNDIFRIFASPDDIAEFSMQVFNRWGEKIFESASVPAGWDGMKMGVYCPAGSYIWIIGYKATAGGPEAEIVTIKGVVELIR
jgi:gliding motility-associated-like protein